MSNDLSLKMQSRNSLLCRLQKGRIAEEFEITIYYIDF